MTENICTHGYSHDECTLCPEIERAATEYKAIKIIPNRADRFHAATRLEKDLTFSSYARKWFNMHCESQGLYVPTVQIF